MLHPHVSHGQVPPEPRGERVGLAGLAPFQAGAVFVQHTGLCQCPAMREAGTPWDWAAVQ